MNESDRKKMAVEQVASACGSIVAKSNGASSALLEALLNGKKRAIFVGAAIHIALRGGNTFKDDLSSLVKIHPQEFADALDDITSGVRNDDFFSFVTNARELQRAKKKCLV